MRIFSHRDRRMCIGFGHATDIDARSARLDAGSSSLFARDNDPKSGGL
jgi:hypothetical protein